MTSLPLDYKNRVYAGWLGKCIGVRFGAPIEGWTYQEIRDNLGELTGYVNEAPDKLFKPDDDTAFPMILIRGLEDYGASPQLTAQQLSDTRQNYIGDQHGTFWWGGYGISTEHTAYLNAAAGIPAPLCGSIALNGAELAEQIGGQIFSDIWGLVAPNDPALAADLAEKAASITHDGNGIYGGRFIAALVSAAFAEPNPFKLIDIGLSHIPPESEYSRVVRAVLDFYQQQPDDWHACYHFINDNFGYDRYGGEVHIIPNAAIIIMALAYGNGDFSRSIQIANMGGWDTDCNVGNVGAMMGVACGLEGIDSAWRIPMNDLLIAASIIGTRNILTIPQCADLFCRLGYELAGSTDENRPRYHFQYSGSTNNFLAHGHKGRIIHTQHHLLPDGRGSLQATIRKLNKKGEVRLFTRTYYRPQELSSNYYEATFSPLVYPGQTVTAKLYLPEHAPSTIRASLYVFDDNHGESHQSTAQPLTPNVWHDLHYTIPALTDACLSEVGVVIRNTADQVWSTGSVYLGALDWDGAPQYALTFAKERPESGGISQWTRLRGYWRLESGAYHGSGVGICESYTGDIDWTDYTLEAEITPLVGDHHYVLTRVQGALYGYAFGLAPDNRVVLYKNRKGYIEVAALPFDWQHGESYRLLVELKGNQIIAQIQDTQLTWVDEDMPYLHGQVGLACWQGSHLRCTRFTLL